MNQNLLGVCNLSQPHMYQSSKLYQPVICEVVRTTILVVVVVVIIPCLALLLRLRGPLQNIRVKQFCMMFQKLLNVPVVRVITVATA